MIVEIPKGSANKYEYDGTLGHILLPKPDRTSKQEDRNSSLHFEPPIESG